MMISKTSFIIAAIAAILVIAGFAMSQGGSELPSASDMETVVAGHGKFSPVNESPVADKIVAWRVDFDSYKLDPTIVKTKSDLWQINATIAKSESPEGLAKLKNQGCRDISFNPGTGQIDAIIAGSFVHGNINSGSYNLVSFHQTKREVWDDKKYDYYQKILYKSLENGIRINKMFRPLVIDVIVLPGRTEYWAEYNTNIDGVSVQKLEELNKILADSNITIRF